MDNEATHDKSIDHEDIVCSITQEVFRDPVRATDGFAYELDAITRWIFQNGTSPLTRQPLRIDELQPDNKLRRLARRRRHSTVSYDARTDTVSLPPIRRVPRPITQVVPIQTNSVTIRASCSKNRKLQVALIIIAIFVITVSVLEMSLDM
ncbi:unnamed protein product [Rotaria sp. Silwood2]|nr:unnamed protein product [Rotaria sp. Silwood2]CAF3985630.1 unnamed protein product [Rotaria sp. Silwood2]